MVTPLRMRMPFLGLDLRPPPLCAAFSFLDLSFKARSCCACCSPAWVHHRGAKGSRPGLVSPGHRNGVVQPLHAHPGMWQTGLSSSRPQMAAAKATNDQRAAATGVPAPTLQVMRPSLLPRLAAVLRAHYASTLPEYGHRLVRPRATTGRTGGGGQEVVTWLCYGSVCT